MIDASAFQLLLMVVTGWLARREREVVAYLIEGRPACPTRHCHDRDARHVTSCAQPVHHWTTSASRRPSATPALARVGT
jgi:hypothetical protein